VTGRACYPGAALDSQAGENTTCPKLRVHYYLERSTPCRCRRYANAVVVRHQTVGNPELEGLPSDLPYPFSAARGGAVIATGVVGNS